MQILYANCQLESMDALMRGLYFVASYNNASSSENLTKIHHIIIIKIEKLKQFKKKNLFFDIKTEFFFKPIKKKSLSSLYYVECRYKH